jgi:tetratricopeptide (TPR) repeat protein
MTGNPSDLNKARDSITSIRHFEPKYMGSIEYGLLSDLGYAYLELGEPEEAERLYKNISDLQMSSESWNNKGVALDEQGKYDDAIKAYDEAIRLDSNLAMVWINKTADLEDPCHGRVYGLGSGWAMVSS